MPMTESVFSVEQLTVNYDKIPVLWDITFHVPAGQMVGILGPNGAGKSTLLKAALSIVSPLSGKVLFFNQPIEKVRKKVAYVPQSSSVDWNFPATVFDVVLMGRYGNVGFFRRPKKQDYQDVLQALEKVGMLSYKETQIGELSGGQKQKLFLARALIQDAEIFLLDEPFAAVDIATEQAIVLLLKELKAKGKTILMVHHDLNTVNRYFDHIILLNTSLIKYGPVEEVFIPEMLQKTFGRPLSLLSDVARLAQEKQYGRIG